MKKYFKIILDISVNLRYNNLNKKQKKQKQKQKQNLKKRGTVQWHS